MQISRPFGLESWLVDGLSVLKALWSTHRPRSVVAEVGVFLWFSLLCMDLLGLVGPGWGLFFSSGCVRLPVLPPHLSSNRLRGTPSSVLRKYSRSEDPPDDNMAAGWGGYDASEGLSVGWGGRFLACEIMARRWIKEGQGANEKKW